MLKTACGNGFPLNIPSEIPTGGGGGTGDYPDLTNKPKINDVTLLGEMTAADLGLASADIEDLIPEDASSSNKLATASDIPDAVTGNPSGSATAGNLTKLQIGDDIYNVPSGSAAYGTFSSTETEIGTWGSSALYRTVVDVGALPSTATSKVISNVIPSNAWIVKCYGMVYTSAQHPQGFQLPLPLASTGNIEDNIMCGIQAGGDVYVSVGKDRSSLTGIVVVEYTKAT